MYGETETEKTTAASRLEQRAMGRRVVAAAKQSYISHSLSHSPSPSLSPTSARRRRLGWPAWLSLCLSTACVLWLRQLTSPSTLTCPDLTDLTDPTAKHDDAGEGRSVVRYCPVFYRLGEEEEDEENEKRTNPPCTWQHPSTFLPAGLVATPTAAFNLARSRDDALHHLRKAFDVLRVRYFNKDVGTWPEAIDWTAAVAQTVSSAVLKTYAREGSVAWNNEINALFSETVSSFYGQNDILIRNEAFDDILWVVLGWIEAIEAVGAAADRYFPTIVAEELPRDEDRWYGWEWVPTFAHRARIFWDLAERGWDFKMCGGGMVWSPHIKPYKNSITNELWISASAAMYLHFTGDNNSTPFGTGPSSTGPPPLYPAHDPKHLAAAMVGYEWLANSGLMNARGLFIDGFHIKDWDRGGTECNLPDGMIYTYNQGVLLSGQHNLWRSTGSVRFLMDGHRLIQSVIAATGWDVAENAPVDAVQQQQQQEGSKHMPPWRGLGRGGILEEGCDADGKCSQDGQTFKGIFFHHFGAFCADIPADPRVTKRGWRLNMAVYDRIRKAHSEACWAYAGWVGHNLNGALMTLDDEGRAGMWWGAGLFASASSSDETAKTSPPDDKLESDQLPQADNMTVTDYRNFGIPADGIWLPEGSSEDEKEVWAPGGGHHRSHVDQGKLGAKRPMNGRVASSSSSSYRQKDVNDRGRGRTVETQIGLVALMRAYHQLQPRRRQWNLVEWGMGLV